MNYTLIMLDNPILVSDEEVNPHNAVWDFENNQVTVLRQSYGLTNYKKIVAGLPDLPKLDLSLIAEEIGWVDVEKLAQKNSELEYPFEDYRGKTKGVDDDGTGQALRGANLVGFENGFKAAQSLNEKKFSEKDFYGLLKLIGQKGYYVECDGTVYANAFDGGDVVDVVKEYSKSLSKPKEYNVEVEMELFNTKQSTDYTPYEKGSLIPIIKITNNTIKVTKIIK